MKEQRVNSQENQRRRRRAVVADAHPSPTGVGFPSRYSDFGSADAGPAGFTEFTQSDASRPEAARRRTATFQTALTNGDFNGVPTDRGERRGPLSAWELADLIRPLPQRPRRRHHPKVTRQAPAIVEYVYKSRVATAAQVQQRFPALFRSYRAVQWHLANLVELRYLATAPVRSTSPNFPYVYMPTRRGVQLVNDTYAGFGLGIRYDLTEGRKGTGVSVQTIHHELLLTEFQNALQTTVGERGPRTVVWSERRFAARDRKLSFEERGRQVAVEPDAGFLIRQQEGTDQTSQNILPLGMLHFVEMDLGTMSPTRFEEKLERYGAWADSESGGRYLERLHVGLGLRPLQSGFRLLVIVHDKLNSRRDERRLVKLFSIATSLPAKQRDRLWFTTVSALRIHRDDPAPLLAEIWCRGRDARGLLRSEERNMAWVADQVRTLGCHRLFGDAQ